jgi:hypothetical protein
MRRDCDKCVGKGVAPTARDGWSIIWGPCPQCNPEKTQLPKELQGKMQDQKLGCNACGATGRSHEACQELGCKTGYQYMKARNLKNEVDYSSLNAFLNQRIGYK